jgi:hypothetical protein
LGGKRVNLDITGVNLGVVGTGRGVLGVVAVAVAVVGNAKVAKVTSFRLRRRITHGLLNSR